MSARIEDGTGTGNVMKVDGRNRARTLSDIRPDVVTDNQQGLVFAAPFLALTPTTGTSIFLWLGNALQGNLYIHQVDLVGAGADVIEMYTDTVPVSLSSGSVVTPVPLNTARTANLATSTGFNSPGTVNVQKGSALSGATSSPVAVGVTSLGAQKSSWIPPSRIQVTPNSTFFLKTQGGNVALSGVVYFSIDSPYGQP